MTAVWWVLIGVAIGMPLGEVADLLDYGGAWRKRLTAWWEWRQSLCCCGNCANGYAICRPPRTSTPPPLDEEG